MNVKMPSKSWKGSLQAHQSLLSQYKGSRSLFTPQLLRMSSIHYSSKSTKKTKGPSLLLARPYMDRS